MPPRPITPSRSLANVRYDIRGPLARRALELERAGQTIIKLNIGNPGVFGFRAPEELRRAMVDHLLESDAYCHQKGIEPARRAVVDQLRGRGIATGIDEVFVGNGVSELIMQALKALLDPGDEVLIPSPDYPLWTAATTTNGGVAVHYPCRRENGFVPDIAELRKLATPRTRALVVISPNNPTGAVYPEAVLRELAAFAEERQLVLFSDEIYDQILYDGAKHASIASFAKGTLCGTFGGLSKVWRACGWRVGWLAFSGATAEARDYLLGIDLLASLRLCGNVPGQWAVPAALAAERSIGELTSPGGRLGQTRQAVIDGVARSRWLEVMAPQGALYAFVRVKDLPGFDDQRFALDLLEQSHVLIAPGNAFNVPYRDSFRITLLPEEATMREVFARIEALLDSHARGARASA